MTHKEKRDQIKFILSKLQSKHHRMFMLMYAQNGETNLNQIIDQMSVAKLSWAVTQCERTYYGLFNQIKYSGEHNINA